MTISENKQVRGMDGFSGIRPVDQIAYLDSENEAALDACMSNVYSTDEVLAVHFINGNVTAVRVLNVHGVLMAVRAEGRKAI